MSCRVIRNTKLELWFLGYLNEKSDLAKYRSEVITSGINDVSSVSKIIKLNRLESIIGKKELAYDKRIPKMINDYFYDMNIVISNAKKYLKRNAYFFTDIGDSIYGNIHIPTDLILIDIFQIHDFQVVDNIELRKRKSKNGELVKQTLIIAKNG